MAQEKISLSSPTEGPWARSWSNPQLGLFDQIRNQVPVYPGQAVAFKASSLQTDAYSVYLFGDALAQGIFGGVCTTYSTSPGNLNAASVSNSDTISIMKTGYMPVMMAPGQVVMRDQYLEPIPSGPYQGMWRLATTSARAHAQSLQAFDDSGNANGSAPGRLCSAFIFLHPNSEGLAGVSGPSDVLTGVTAETAYTTTTNAVTTPIALMIPANSVRLRSRYRAVFAIEALNGASGATLFKGYLQPTVANPFTPVAANRFFSSISTTPAAGDVVQVHVEFSIGSLTGSNNVFLSGTATVGTPGAATARSLGIACTMDPTVDNYLTVTCTPANVADQSELTFVSLEKVS